MRPPVVSNCLNVKRLTVHTHLKPLVPPLHRYIHTYSPVMEGNNLFIILDDSKTCPSGPLSGPPSRETVLPWCDHVASAPHVGRGVFSSDYCCDPLHTCKVVLIDSCSYSSRDFDFKFLDYKNIFFLFSLMFDFHYTCAIFFFSAQD